MVKECVEKTKLRKTIRGRIECLKKKLMELSTLCDVKACVVCLGPDGEVDSWPENSDEVKAVLDIYREYDACGNKRRKVKEMDADSGAAATDEKMVGGFGGANCWYSLDGLSEERIVELVNTVDENLKQVNDRVISFVNNYNNSSGSVHDDDGEMRMMQIGSLEPNYYNFVDYSSSSAAACVGGNAGPYPPPLVAATPVIWEDVNSLDFEGENYSSYHGSCDSTTISSGSSSSDNSGGLINDTTFLF